MSTCYAIIPNRHTVEGAHQSFGLGETKALQVRTVLLADPGWDRRSPAL